MPATPHCKALRQQGFTLLEILVAVIVLSLGLLGAVGMLTAAARSNREARLQSAAVLLSRDLADRMRANKDEALKSAGNSYLTDTTFGTSWTAPAAANCISSTCTGGAMAAWDIRDWLTRVNAELPGARVVVCYDTAPFDAAGVPAWGCAAPAAGASGTGYVKIGWTRAIYRNGANPGNTIDAASQPIVVIPVIAGSTL